MPRGNSKNLIPNSERTPDELREQTRKGGIISGQKRREKKLLSQIYAEILMDEYNVNIDGTKKTISGSNLVKAVARDVLMRRDGSSVTMMKEIREATEGSKIKIENTPESLDNVYSVLMKLSFSSNTSKTVIALS